MPDSHHDLPNLMGCVKQRYDAVVLDGTDLTDAQWAVLEPTLGPRRRVRWSSAPVDRYARRVERRALGAADRCAVAPLAPSISAVSNVPTALSAVAAEPATRSTAPAARRGSARPRQAGSDRSVRRRHIRRGKKRAFSAVTRGSPSQRDPRIPNPESRFQPPAVADTR